MSEIKELWSSEGYIARLGTDTAMVVGKILRSFATPLIAFSV